MNGLQKVILEHSSLDFSLCFKASLKPFRRGDIDIHFNLFVPDVDSLIKAISFHKHGAVIFPQYVRVVTQLSQY